MFDVHDDNLPRSVVGRIRYMFVLVFRHKFVVLEQREEPWGVSHGSSVTNAAVY